MPAAETKPATGPPPPTDGGCAPPTDGGCVLPATSSGVVANRPAALPRPRPDGRTSLGNSVDCGARTHDRTGCSFPAVGNCIRPAGYTRPGDCMDCGAPAVGGRVHPTGNAPSYHCYCWR